MKKRGRKAAAVLLLILVCGLWQGCGQARTAPLVLDLAAEAETSGETAEKTEAEISAETAAGGSTVGGAGTAGTEADASEETAFVVYVCGAVARPGLYEASSGDRVGDVIERAGGLSEDAAADRLNLARRVRDEEQIYVPRLGEDTSVLSGDRPGDPAEADGSAASGAQAAADAPAQEPADGRLDVNRASRTQLMSLPGIGEARADAILAYRQEHGPFQNVQQLLKVPGIGPAVLRRFSDRVRADP